MKPEDVPTVISTVESRVNEWLSTKSFIKSARQIAYPDRVELRLSDLEVVFEQVSESFGRRVDDGSCGEMEDSLIQVQSESGTGRVRLVDFYKGRMSADFTLDEKPAYLRDQGALDESDPSNPFVIIPNYMRMQSNCINSSDYYQVCCRDLCEDLMDKLESDIRAPHASPDVIMSILRNSDSTSVFPGRVWFEELEQKLWEVAEQHGGQVSLHSRPMAQWMHLAYPLECAYPHLPGTIRPSSPSEWELANGESFTASAEEMERLVDAGGLLSNTSARVPECDDSEEGMCMWAPVEELVDAEVPRAEDGDRSSWIRTVLRSIAVVAMVLSSATVMYNTMKETSKAVMITSKINLFMGELRALVDARAKEAPNA